MNPTERNRSCPNAFSSLGNEVSFALLQKAPLGCPLVHFEHVLIVLRDHQVSAVKMWTKYLTRAWLTFTSVWAILVFSSI